MSDPLHQPVDVDRLADYVEGLLSTADEAAVEHLIDHDPAWARAAATLRTAAPQVTAVLSAAAASVGPMPNDLAARISASLRSLPPKMVTDQSPVMEQQTIAEPSATTTPLAAQKPATKGQPTKRPRGEASGRPDGYPDRRRYPRRGRLAPRTTAWIGAAAVLVVLALGVGFLTHLPTGRTASSSAVGAKAASPQYGLPAISSRPDLAITSSGTDYTEGSLLSAGVGSTPATIVPPGINKPAVTPPGLAASGAVNPALDRLLDPNELSVCLTAIERITGGMASRADFASYLGQAAVIVTVVTPGTGVEVVAAGARCGLVDAGADEIASTPVR